MGAREGYDSRALAAYVPWPVYVSCMLAKTATAHGKWPCSSPGRKAWHLAGPAHARIRCQGVSFGEFDCPPPPPRVVWSRPPHHAGQRRGGVTVPSS